MIDLRHRWWSFDWHSIMAWKKKFRSRFSNWINSFHWNRVDSVNCSLPSTISNPITAQKHFPIGFTTSRMAKKRTGKWARTDYCELWLVGAGQLWCCFRDSMDVQLHEAWKRRAQSVQFWFGKTQCCLKRNSKINIFVFRFFCLDFQSLRSQTRSGRFHISSAQILFASIHQLSTLIILSAEQTRDCQQSERALGKHICVVFLPKKRAESRD